MAVQQEKLATERTAVRALGLRLISTLGRPSAPSERCCGLPMLDRRMRTSTVIAAPQRMPRAMCVICQPYWAMPRSMSGGQRAPER
jgi:hypothetical protein